MVNFTILYFQTSCKKKIYVREMANLKNLCRNWVIPKNSHYFYEKLIEEQEKVATIEGNKTFHFFKLITN